MSQKDRDITASELQREFVALRRHMQQMPLSQDVRALVERLRAALRVGPDDPA